MRILFRTRVAAFLAGGLALFLMMTPALQSQIDPDKALRKKYEKFLGKYELEESVASGEAYTMEVVVRQGALWIDDGDGRPAEIKPVEGAPLEFVGEDSQNGSIQIFFTTDDSGAVVKIRIVMPKVALDMTCVKLK